MALQDLTPQLRTRLNRTEKAAGWFVFVATALLIVGFGYYLYHTARSRGWFITKIQYQTGVNNAAGLKVGDPVKLMGFDAGTITGVIPNDPNAYFGVTIYFNIKAENYGYIWSDSSVKVQSDFIGNRYLEVTKGKDGVPTVLSGTNGIFVIKHKYFRDEQKRLEKESKDSETQGQKGKSDVEIVAELKRLAAADEFAFYDRLANASPCWIRPDESPALNDRLEKVASQVEAALPNVLAYTNQIAVVLVNAANLTSNLNAVAASARPMVDNLQVLTEQLKGPGALGEWAVGTNFPSQVSTAMDAANLTINHADTNLVALFESFTASLENLAGITSNLNAQVQANPNMLTNISSAIVDTDDLVQGLKRHWLLRSAFKKKAGDPPPKSK